MSTKQKLTSDELKIIYNSWKRKKFLLGSMSKGAITIGRTRIIDFSELISYIESTTMTRGWGTKSDVWDFDFWNSRGYRNLYEIRDDGTLKNIHRTLRTMLRQGLIVKIPGKSKDYHGRERDVFYPKFIAM